MSTVPITCPRCGVYLRVAVQPSSIAVSAGKLHVQFDDQNVAHMCHPDDLKKFKERKKR